MEVKIAGREVALCGLELMSLRGGLIRQVSLVMHMVATWKCSTASPLK